MPLILYVDDEEHALKYMRRALDRQCDLISCQDTDEALQVIDERGEELDVVIADERMPRMSGRELLRVTQLRNKKTSRILTTAFADVSCLADCLNEGLLDKIILKPWDADMLANEIISVFTAKAAANMALSRNECFANLDATTKRLQVISSAFAAHANFSDYDAEKEGLISLLDNEVGSIGTIIDEAYANQMSRPMLLSRETCDLEDCLNQAVAKLPSVNQKAERLDMELPAGRMLVRSSPSSLVMILSELLSYAFLIAQDANNGKVTVRTHKEFNFVCVEICGSGTVDLLEVARQILVGSNSAGALGLSVISWIIRQSGGRFTANFKDDSSFVMTLTYPLLLN